MFILGVNNMAEFKYLENLPKGINEIYLEILSDIMISNIDIPPSSLNVRLNKLNILINRLRDSYNKKLSENKIQKHLQIGDEFYILEGIAVHTRKVYAIALEPDNTIIYNWKYRADRIYLNLNDVINALQEQHDALIDRLKDDLKGGE